MRVCCVPFVWPTLAHIQHPEPDRRRSHQTRYVTHKRKGQNQSMRRQVRHTMPEEILYIYLSTIANWRRSKCGDMPSCVRDAQINAFRTIHDSRCKGGKTQRDFARQHDTAAYWQLHPKHVEPQRNYLWQNNVCKLSHLRLSHQIIIRLMANWIVVGQWLEIWPATIRRPHLICFWDNICWFIDIGI